MTSRYSSRFRVAASGVKEMSQLIISGSSPLNNLRHQYLSVLSPNQARELIDFGFPDGLDAKVERGLLERTGCHPYLLQGLLEQLWEDRDHLDE